MRNSIDLFIIGCVTLSAICFMMLSLYLKNRETLHQLDLGIEERIHQLELRVIQLELQQEVNP